MVPFIRKFDSRLRQYPNEPVMNLLRAVHLQTVRDKQRAIDESIYGYGKKPREKKDPSKDASSTTNKSKRKPAKGKKQAAPRPDEHIVSRQKDKQKDPPMLI